MPFLVNGVPKEFDLLYLHFLMDVALLYDYLQRNSVCRVFVLQEFDISHSWFSNGR